VPRHRSWPGSTERRRNDVVAVLIVLALAASGLLKPDKALSGLGSEPAVVVLLAPQLWRA